MTCDTAMENQMATSLVQVVKISCHYVRVITHVTFGLTSLMK